MPVYTRTISPEPDLQQLRTEVRDSIAGLPANEPVLTWEEDSSELSLEFTNALSSQEIDAIYDLVDNFTPIGFAAKQGLLQTVTVEDFDVVNPNTLSPAIGDKWLIANNPFGDWSGQKDNIAEWNGIDWNFYEPGVEITTETVVNVRNSENSWMWNGTGWRKHNHNPYWTWEEFDQSSTNSLNFISKIDVDTISLVKATYKLEMFCELSGDNWNFRTGVMLRVNDADQIGQTGSGNHADIYPSHGNTPKSGVYPWIPVSSWVLLEDIEGVHNLKLMYRTNFNYINAFIRNAKLLLWRLS